MTNEQKINNAIIELNRSMKLAAEREEFLSAYDFQRIREFIS